MDYEEKISNGLKLYLREVEGITGEIVYASLSDFDSGGQDGCDTCGHGASGMSFDIGFQVKGQYGDYRTIEMDPLHFFAVLLPYIDRANQ